MVRSTCFSGRMLQRGRHRTGYPPIRPGNSRYFSASTGPKSRSSTRFGSSRTSNRPAPARRRDNHRQAGLMEATMNWTAKLSILAAAFFLPPDGASTQGSPHSSAVPVTADNFIRAESDMFFGGVVKQGAFGKFYHNRTPMSVDFQNVVRGNRDTLYSPAVID